MNRIWKIDPDLLDSTGLSAEEFLESYRELVEMGLVTETKPETEDEGPTFAVVLYPLANPEQFSQEVRDRHAANMKKWSGVAAADLLGRRH